MGKIQADTKELAQAITMLSEKSQEIGKIVEVISGIANQTNLLALNAAIEAARAGEHGRGFAVVAEEVRKLAEQSSVSTKEIVAIISSIQEEMERAAQKMHQGSIEVEEGVRIANQAGVVLNEIIDRIDQSVEAIKQIAGGSRQSSESTQQLASATQQVTYTIQQQATATQDLARMAENLKDLVAQFKL